MKRTIRQLAGASLIALTLPLVQTASVFAQDSPDTRTPNQAAATHTDQGFNWGWLGALGLVGLLGLTGLNRRHTETMTRTTAVRP